MLEVLQDHGSAEPLGRVRVEELPSLFRLTRLTSVWACPVALDTGPGLATRIRGAWGRRLLAWSEARNADADEARRLFFPDKATVAHAAPGLAPFLIAADEVDGNLFTTLTLIGTAARCQSVAFDAFVSALSRPPGLSLAANGSARMPLRNLQSTAGRISGIPVRPLEEIETLTFHTPLKIGPPGCFGNRFGDVLFSIADRAARLAVHETLEVEGQPGRWRQIAERQTIDASRMRPTVLDHISSSGGTRRLLGYLGPMTIVRPEPEIAPLLAMGAYLHAGAHAGYGLGRYSY